MSYSNYKRIMIQKTIKLFATQIPYTKEELEENEVYVEFNVGELLDEIDNEDIADYARWRLDMIPEDDVRSNIEDFSEDELVEALRDSWYDFSKEVDEDEMVSILEDKGYLVSDERNISNDYDYVDNCLFEDIVNKFNSLSFFDRQKMRDLIINL